MATLEKIRNKSVMLFTIIIVALLAFILGDFFTSGRSFFGVGDKVATANGATVKYTDYQNKQQEFEDMLKQQDQSINPDERSEQVIQTLLMQGLLDNEYDRMGITVTANQLSGIMLGNSQQSIYVLYQLAQNAGINPQTLMQAGIADGKTFYDAMNNPAKYQLPAEYAAAFKSAWIKTENDITEGLKANAYMSLAYGLFTANKIDAQATYNDRSVSSTFTFVTKPYSAISDADAEKKLTDADYEKVYNERKSAFKLDEEKRLISYIVVDIAPSAKDQSNAIEEVTTLFNELKENEGVDVVNQHSNFEKTTAKYTSEKLGQDPILRMLTTDSVPMAAGTVRNLGNQNGKLYLAKVLDVTTGVDDVTFSILPLPEKKEAADSLMSLLNVAQFDSLARINQGNVALQTSLITPNPQMPLPEKMYNVLAEQAVNNVFTFTDTIKTQDEKGAPVNQPVSYAMLITKRSEPVTVYNIATIDYEIIPSQETITELTQNFHNFVATNGTAEAFAKNAEKAGYTVYKAMVGASSPIGNLAPGSMSTVKWAMNADKGDVSKVYNCTKVARQNGSNDYMLAVAVDEIFDGEYMPVTAQYVKDTLKPLVLNAKKASMLAEQAKGAKTINAVATNLGVKVSEQPGTSTFGDDFVTGVGFGEGNVQGAIAAAKPGTLVGPIQGNSGVYYIVVSENKNGGRPFNALEAANTFMANAAAPIYMIGQQGQPMGLSLPTLIGDNKVKNNILEFTADDK